jgi:beta-glucanase (GH16 family)
MNIAPPMDKNALKAIKDSYGYDKFDNSEIVTLDDGRQYIGWYIDGNDITTVKELEANYSDQEIWDIYHEVDEIAIEEY